MLSAKRHCGTPCVGTPKAGTIAKRVIMQSCSRTAWARRRPALGRLCARSSQMLDQMHDPAVVQCLDALARVAVPLVPGDVSGKLLAGVKAHAGSAELPRPHLGGRQEPPAMAMSPRLRRDGHAPQQ